MRRWGVIACVVAFAASPVFAIEAPKSTSAPTPPAAETQNQTVAEADPRMLQSNSIRAAHRQRLAELKVAPGVIDALVATDVAKAIALLSAASANDAGSNIAIVRLQRWCVRIPPRDRHRDSQLLEQLSKQLSEVEIARLRTYVNLELDYLAAAQKSCQQAQFDYRAIESQLRAFAEHGEPMSVTELARIGSPAEAEALLKQAVDKNYAPAQYALATLRLIGVQRGERTQDVASIRLLLKQAGRSSTRAKLDLANCIATGCDGHPNDVSGAVVFGLDAARDGERDAFTSIARMPWGGQLPFEQRLAWQYFAQHLNETGCFGEDYLSMFALLRENVLAYEKATNVDLQSQARKLADQYWKDFSSRAMREQQCGS